MNTLTARLRFGAPCGMCLHTYIIQYMDKPQVTNYPGQLAFTINQFCTAVGISRRTLYTLWERNQGPPRVAVGKRVLIPRAGAEAWLQAQPAG